jgi:ATP-binding protein involved in chromosome partitioning
MDEDAVLERLRRVEDPKLGSDIVSLSLVEGVTVADGVADVEIALNAPFSPAETEIASRVREEVRAMGLEVDLTQHPPERSADRVLPDVTNVVAVASGKGGVGKSTLAVNAAAGLADRGARVGLFDADVYGPNVPRMLDQTRTPDSTREETIIPPEKYGMKLMSMGLLVDEDDPVIWRGPMIHKVITQLVEDVEWGSLDYLVIDLPPGTGDTQLTMLQTVPLTGSVVVTTPQEVAVDDARKGLRMFGRHDSVVLGIAENMGTFVCPDCGSEHAVFGEGGGERFAAENDLPFLGSIPLDPAVRSGADEGRPIVLDDDSATGEAFRDVAAAVADQVGIVNRRDRANAGEE